MPAAAERRAEVVPHVGGHEADLDVGRETAPPALHHSAQGVDRHRPPRRREPGRAEHRAEHLRDLRAVRVELEHELAVLAEEAVARPVETVHVALQPMAQGDTRDREPAARVVDQAREELALVVVDRGKVRRHDRGEQRDAVRRARRRQIGAFERDPPRRHVPTRVPDDQLGEQHQGPPDRCSVPLMVPDAEGPAHTGRDATRLGACPSYPKIPFDLAAVRATRPRRLPTAARASSAPSSPASETIISCSSGTTCCIAFLAKFPTLLGYTLLAPLEHRTDAVGSFSESEYVELQRRVHRLGRAVSESRARRSGST